MVCFPFEKIASYLSFGVLGAFWLQAMVLVGAWFYSDFQNYKNYHKIAPLKHLSNEKHRRLSYR